MADDAVTRAAEFAALAFGPPVTADTEAALEGAATHDPDGRVRAAALAALARAGTPGRSGETWRVAAGDRAAVVRRRAAEVAPGLAGRGDAGPLVPSLLRLLEDDDVTVVDAAAWALGELGDDTVGDRGVAALAKVAVEHPDALAREAAVAALGALGDDAGLPAILAGCRDKPAIRRRAVLALAAFEGPEVEDALARARADRDWQVRQGAEDLESEEHADPERRRRAERG